MKNLLLLLTMLIFSSTVFSQLYVQPNGATDSYVYVQDEVLFVENDINLQENNSGTEQASIYLREGSQLIQGSGSTLNSGDGYISVFQNTEDDDEWDYTFWCSPVGNMVNTGSQNFGILRIHDSLSVTNSLVTAVTTTWSGLESPLTISTRWLYKFETPGSEQEDNYERIRSNNVVKPGFGFTMKGVGTTNHAQRYDFRGRPNNGDMVIPVKAPIGGVPQMTLSGNPYASAIDLVDVIADNSNLNAVWYWDEDRDIDSHYYADNRGGYGTWVPAGGPDGIYNPPAFIRWDSDGNQYPGGGNNGASYQRRYAPIGQGFMLIGQTDGNVTIKNSHREYVKEGASSAFRISDDQDPKNDSKSLSTLEDPRWPQIRIVTSFGDSHSRELVLLFHEKSTDGYDHGMDALHPMDAASEVYFKLFGATLIDGVNNDNPYIIETVPFSQAKKIPISFQLNQGQDLIIETVEKINLNSQAYIFDNVNNSYKKITDGEEALITLPAGTYHDRFFIVFKGQRQLLEDSDGTKAIDIAKASVGFFQNNPYQQMEVTNPEGYDIKTAAVYDMTGKLVATKHNVGTVSNFNIPTSNLTDGVYLVKLTTIENINIDYKTIIQNN